MLLCTAFSHGASPSPFKSPPATPPTLHASSQFRTSRRLTNHRTHSSTLPPRSANLRTTTSAVPETPIPDTDAYTPRTVASSAMQRAFRLAPPRRTHSSREAQLLALMDRGADAAKRDAAAVAVREVVAAVSRLAARACVLVLFRVGVGLIVLRVCREARALVGAALLQARYIDELD